MAFNKSNQTSGIPHDMKEYEAWIIAIGKHTPLVLWKRLGKSTEYAYAKCF